MRRHPDLPKSLAVNLSLQALADPAFRSWTCGLLAANPDPDENEIKEALSGNICRCTGYGRILEAVERVAISRRSGS